MAKKIKFVSKHKCKFNRRISIDEFFEFYSWSTRMFGRDGPDNDKNWNLTMNGFVASTQEMQMMFFLKYAELCSEYLVK